MDSEEKQKVSFFVKKKRLIVQLKVLFISMSKYYNIIRPNLFRFLLLLDYRELNNAFTYEAQYINKEMNFFC
jgi:hypothetical protein